MSLEAASPPSKTLRLEESDLLEAFYPSDEEDSNASLKGCEVIYLLEELSLASRLTCGSGI